MANDPKIKRDNFLNRNLPHVQDKQATTVVNSYYFGGKVFRKSASSWPWKFTKLDAQLDLLEVKNNLPQNVTWIPNLHDTANM